ncbi:hypothetical protein HMI56_000786 [Coelomomyces lativittatus]|nr:hypothetical protein HMI56_000786 [Coelomomyces lativittatus]
MRKIFSPTSLSVPESLLIHFLEVYLPILVATSSKIPSVAWPFLLEPLFTYVAFSNRRHLIPLVSQTFRNKALLDLQKHPESCQPILRHIQSHFSTMQVSKKGKNTVATLLRPFSCVS